MHRAWDRPGTCQWHEGVGVPDRCSQVVPGAELVSVQLGIPAAALGTRAMTPPPSLFPPGGPLRVETRPGTSGESHVMPTHRCSSSVSQGWGCILP